MKLPVPGSTYFTYQVPVHSTSNTCGSSMAGVILQDRDTPADLEQASTLLISMSSRQSTYTRTTSDHEHATQCARITRTTTPPSALPKHPRHSTRLHGTYPRIPDVSPTSRPHLFRGLDRQLASLLETLGTPSATSSVHSAAPTNPTMRKVIAYPTTISIQSDPLHDHITTRGRRRNSYHRMSLEEQFNNAPHSQVSTARNIPLYARST